MFAAHTPNLQSHQNLPHILFRHVVEYRDLAEQPAAEADRGLEPMRAGSAIVEHGADAGFLTVIPGYDIGLERPATTHHVLHRGRIALHDSGDVGFEIG